jgi:hypothetical protein
MYLDVRLWTNISETVLYITVCTTYSVTVADLPSLVDVSPLLFSGVVTDHPVAPCSRAKRDLVAVLIDHHMIQRD